ncbi:MAG: Gmad2 immunoglobulin-like domain-containing protein [Chloroflexi bacterium]|nr:Gmad2 immunoglobulin-like domain-containing protein [Chloroflexota bacterium]
MPRLTIVTIAAIIALAFAACADQADAPSPFPSPSPTPFPNVCLPNPDPATSEFQILDAPDPFTEVTSPVTVSGQVNAFESVYQISIFDAGGTALVETFGTAQQPDIGIIGPFSSDVAFTVSEPTPACLWVFEESARDGSPINVGQVPLILLP